MYLISRCVMLTCLIGSATVRANEEGPCGCPCPDLQQLVDLTEPANVTACCKTGGRFRYKCVAGYVREAGTSNLVTCTNRHGTKEWSHSQLRCIRDPKIVITTKQPSVSTSPPPPPGDPKIVITTKQPSVSTSPPPPPAPVPGPRSPNPTARHDSPTRGIHQLAPSIPVVTPTHADTLPTTPPGPATPPGPTTPPGPATPPAPATPPTTQGTTGNPGGLGSSAVPEAAGPPSSSEGGSGATVGTGVSVVLVLVLCASAGLLFCLWRRKKRNAPSLRGNPVATELDPMNPKAGAGSPRPGP